MASVTTIPTANLPMENATFGAVKLEVGVPSFVAQIFNGELIVRMLTLRMFDDYSAMPSSDKLRVIFRVAVVGLLTLGICAAAVFMNPLFVWAVPLCLIVTMGVGFSLMTIRNQKQDVSEVPLEKKPTEPPKIVDDPNWGRGYVLGRKGASSNTSTATQPIRA